MKTLIARFTLGLALLGAAATTPAQTPLAAYDIQFGFNGGQQTGAAVVGQAGDYWNFFTSASGTATLQDSSNHLSGVSLTWAGSGVYSFTPTFGGGDGNLMGGYLYTTAAGAQTVSFSGLPANQSCALYIYTQGDSGGGGRQLRVTVNGNTYTAAPGVASATTFVAGQNYLCITNVTDASGNLSFTYTYAADGEADINGIQLQLRAAPTGPALVHRYLFDGDASDSVGTANGTLEGTATITNTGAYAGSQSLRLDGNGDVSLPAMDLTSRFTIAAWVWVNSGDFNIQTILANAGSGTGTDGFKFDVNTWETSDRNLMFESGNGEAGAQTETTNGVCQFGQWVHVACVVDKANGLTLYYNGTNVASFSGALLNFQTTSALKIGKMLDNWYGFQGMIDDLQIYSGALTAAEIQSLYANPGGAYPVPDTWVGNTSTNFSGLNWTGANNPPVSGDALVFGPAGTSGTTLNADQAPGITYPGITFNTNASTYTIAGVNGITLTGGITNNSANYYETLNFPINCPDEVTIAGDANEITLGGVISGAGGVTVIGYNALTLNGTNTYTGPTLVSQGVLYLNGSLAAGSAVTLATNSFLAGHGTAAGTVAVYGLLTPNFGTLNTGPETWYGSQLGTNAGVCDGYIVHIDENYSGTAGTDWDLVNINGALTIAATSDLPFLIYPLTILNSSFDNTQDYTWRIATASGGITGFDPSKFTIATDVEIFSLFCGPFISSVTSGLGTGQFVVTQTNNDLRLQFVHPVANQGTVYRAFGTYMRIPVSVVLANISDAPGPLTLISVTSQNPDDYVQISGTNVLFAPANPNEPVSTLNYSAQLTYGAPATNVITGALTVAATNAAGTSRSITITNGQAAVSFAGMPGSKYMVQRSTNLVDWVNLDGASGLPDSTITNSAATGIWTFTDPNPPAPSAFYRTVQAYFSLLWGNMNSTYNGTAQTATAWSSPPGMAVSFTYNGSSAAPINAGSYTVIGTIADGSFTGSMTNTLTIAKATATITLTDNGDGTVTATTSPPGLATSITYQGDNMITATGTITDPNYTGPAAQLTFVYMQNQ